VIFNFKKLFSREQVLEADLRGYSLAEILSNLGSETEGVSDLDYFKKIVDENHIILSPSYGKAYERGTHVFEYFPSQKEIQLKSKLHKYGASLYIYLLLPMITIFSDNFKEIAFEIFLLEIGFFLFLSLILILGIKEQSKGIEREVIIRINHNYRTQKPKETNL